METCCHNAEIYVCLFVEKTAKQWKQKRITKDFIFKLIKNATKLQDSDPNDAISLIILIS